MSRRFLPRALRSAFANFVLAPGEVTHAQDQNLLYLGDGKTPGGIPMFGGVASITNYGAYPGAPAAVNSAAIMAAWAVNSVIHVPPGIYDVSPNVLEFISDGQEMFGDGSDVSVLRMSATTGTLLGSPYGRTGISLHHLGLEGPASGATAGALLDLSQVAVSQVNLYNLAFTGGYDGARLGVTNYSTIASCFASGQAYRGFRFMAGAEGRGELQWQRSNLLAQECGDDGITVEASSAAPQITLGTDSNLSTFANTGHGQAYYGSSACPINDLDWTGGTNGSNGKSNVFFDTYGKNNKVSSILAERAGLDATGPGLATAATLNAPGIEITGSNLGLLIDNSEQDNNAYESIETGGRGVLISNNRCNASGSAPGAAAASRASDILQNGGTLQISNIVATGQGTASFLLTSYDGAHVSVSQYATVGHTVATGGVEALFYFFNNAGSFQKFGGIGLV